MRDQTPHHRESRWSALIHTPDPGGLHRLGVEFGRAPVGDCSRDSGFSRGVWSHTLITDQKALRLAYATRLHLALPYPDRS
jgi:hypothetical protein